MPVVAGCAACMIACSKGIPDIDPDPVPPSPDPPPLLPFTINLQTDLLATGDTVKRNGVIVVRRAVGNSVASFIALELNCSHAGGILNWNQATQQFICPVHGSVFAANGTVVNGPATTALASFTISINGTMMTIS